MEPPEETTGVGFVKWSLGAPFVLCLLYGSGDEERSLAQIHSKIGRMDVGKGVTRAE